MSKQNNVVLPENFDPVQLITNTLRDAGHPRPSDWEQHLHPDALKAETPTNVKRFLVNRTWHVILGELQTQKGVDTMNQRYVLVDQATDIDWWRLFQNTVIRCILIHELPLLPNSGNTHVG